MNHIGDTNKMVSETPRTDSRRGFHGWYTAVDAEFSERLERELNAANARIKQLEDRIDRAAKAFFADCPDEDALSKMLAILEEERRKK